MYVFPLEASGWWAGWLGLPTPCTRYYLRTVNDEGKSASRVSLFSSGSSLSDSTLPAPGGRAVATTRRRKFE
jgi:hypothetical protein